jgi:formylglycine-generating enzyme required for sulfatase activity
MLVLLLACAGSPGRVREAPALSVDSDVDDTDTDAETDAVVDSDLVPGPCPVDMVEVESWCMDRYEAPNVAGELPLVMYRFIDAEDWCDARGKRLCFDDEWTQACAGSNGWAYPYGPTQQPGECNDDKVWRTYTPSLLQGWPSSASGAGVTSLQDLWDAVNATAPATAEHLQWLYQGDGAGDNPGCGGEYGVYDLTGNVEEWTRRRDGGTADFHGNLKGRYWAETRTCQNNITTHGDYFRFYEIGFRCCLDVAVGR